MARCLRCGAGNEWIEPVMKEPLATPAGEPQPADADARRLDWLESNGRPFSIRGDWYAKGEKVEADSFRGAIDAAMQPEPRGSGEGGE